MHAPFQHHPEIFLRYGVGLLLWGSSAFLTISLFFTIAGPTWGRRLFMILLALALEGAKILTWRMGKSARVLASALLALSGVASLGAALQTVAATKSSFMVVSLAAMKQGNSYKAMATELEGIDREISISIDRLSKVPPDFTTAATNLSMSLQRLRVRRTSLQNALDDLESISETSYNNSNLFVLLGRALNIAPETLLLLILLFMSACIETGALILTAPIQPIQGLTARKTRCATQAKDGIAAPMSQDGPIGATEFLAAASEGAPLPYLHGRDTTARKLSISSYEAKKLVRELLASGAIKVEGKRLKVKGRAESL